MIPVISKEAEKKVDIISKWIASVFMLAIGIWILKPYLNKELFQHWRLIVGTLIFSTVTHDIGIWLHDAIFKKKDKKNNKKKKKGSLSYAQQLKKLKVPR